MFRNALLFLCVSCLLLPSPAWAQAEADSLPSQQRPFHQTFGYLPATSLYQHRQQLDPKRKKAVNRLALGGYSLGMLYLGVVWYANEDLGRFRFFNDAHEWQQMDKAGHMLGGFHESRFMIDLYRWAGVPKRKALITGGLAGFLAQTSIEVFDGFGESWGASLPDVGANLLGSALAMGNYALWNEPRVQLKMSYWPSSRARSGEFQELFGSHPAEWLVKDYNGQTYWLSVRLHSFLPEGGFKDVYPPWLNLALGYGADGLEGGYGKEDWAIIRAREYRQFYLSLDIDLQQIPTRSGFLNTLFSLINVVRIPLPALQVDRHGVTFTAFQ